MFVTCRSVPSLDPDDRVMLRELERRGMQTAIGVWNDPGVAWSAARLCVLRSTWDYHRQHREFLCWIDRVSALTTIRNDPDLLRWNADKSYLHDLEALGIPIVPTVRVARRECVSLGDLARERGWHDVVVKPSQGAGAHDVLLVRNAGANGPQGQAHLDRLSQSQAVLVQPYLHGVSTYGERALVFFAGRYSHAVLKKPFDTDLTVSGARSSVVDASGDEVAVAKRAIAALPKQSLYARVDLLRGDAGEVYVGEVELVEPALYFRVHEPARLAFADAIERELGATLRSSE